jgi:DNA polymerase-3 subunit beta
VKVSCLQENLARGLQIVGRGVSSRSTLPILSNVLIRTDGGRLKLTTTNLEIGVNAWVLAKIEDEGGITVPAKLFADFVNSLPAGQVDLALNVRTKTLHVASGPYEANIKGIDAEEFPVIPTVPDKPTTRMTQSALRRVINEVAFVAATDDSRPVLTGVLTRLEGDEVRLVSADPYRLALCTTQLLQKVDPSIEVIIPARSLFEVARVLSDTDAPVEIAVTPNKSQVIFHTDDVDVVSRLIEGQFPNYRQVIPSSYSTRIVVERDELLKATKLASYFARDAANIVRLQVNPNNGAPLVVSATAAEVGDNVGRVDATVEGKQTQIAFNARFLSEALGSLTAPEVALELGGPVDPGVLKVVGDESYLHVVMPLRIPG